MTKFLRLMVIINLNGNVFIFTFSIFKKENQPNVNPDLFSFLKIEEFFIIIPFENRFERVSVFIQQVSVKNSSGRRPAVYGIIRADLASFSIAYFLRQRFSFGSDQKIVTTDENFFETLPVGPNLRLRPTWNYQEATGLLTSKVDDNAESVSYTYTTAGQLLTRTWARGPVTTYGYDTNTGELLTVNYSDSTPDVTFTYDRLGRISTVADGLGSRTFAYNAALQPLSETISGLYSKTITRTYAGSGVVGRPTGLNTGTDYSISYDYDSKGRFDEVGWSVVAGAYTGTANYGFVTNSDLIGTLTTTAGQSTTYSYEANRNLRTQINNQFSSTLISQYAYQYDALGRRTSVVNTGSAFAASAFNRYVYNDRSELNESARYLGTDINILTSPVTAELRDYVYDPIGNRTDYTVGTNIGDYTANNLNQYSGENVAGGGSNSFTYDDDGNLTAISGNKNVQYVYNAENQVITMQPTTPALNDKKVDSVYDYQGRRVQRIVSNWSGVAWVPLTTKRFVYDGWNVIEEQTVAGTSKYYVWGLDLSQSPQGAGGVGGLLTTIEGTASNAFLYDGNGNVSQLVDTTTGLISAHYEYDPYGNQIVASGSLAASNTYRFSTKYLDTEYNLYYYGYRYYDPVTGRWLNIDPLSEPSFLLRLGLEDSSIPDSFNRYGFSLNNPIDYQDLFGLVVGEKVTKRGGLIIVEKILQAVGISTLDGPSLVIDVLVIGSVIKAVVDVFKHDQELMGIRQDDPCSVEIVRGLQAKERKFVDGFETYKLSQVSLSPSAFPHRGKGISFFETQYLPQTEIHPFILPLTIRIEGEKAPNSVHPIAELPGEQAMYTPQQGEGHWDVLAPSTAVSGYAKEVKDTSIRLNHAYIGKYPRREDL